MSRPARLLVCGAVACTVACSTVFGFDHLREGADVEDAKTLSDAPASGADVPDAKASDANASDVNATDADANVMATGCPPPGDAAAGCPSDGIVWNGRCYFVVPPFLTRQMAVTACSDRGAELATFTCADEWFNAGVVSSTNAWIGAYYDGASWRWGTGEPFGYFPPSGDFFDGSAPVDGATCMWRSGRGAWAPVPCTANSAGAYCERGPH